MTGSGFAIAMALVTGCVGAIDRSEFESEVRHRGGGVTSELTVDPLDALRSRIDDPDPELLSMSISPLQRTMVMEVRDPVQRRNVDRYVSRNGGLDSPEPVQVSAADDLDRRSFRLSELPVLTDLERLADDSIAEFGFADAYVDVTQVAVFNGTPVLRVRVESPRSAGWASFDGSGALIGTTVE